MKTRGRNRVRKKASILFLDTRKVLNKFYSHLKSLDSISSISFHRRNTMNQPSYLFHFAHKNIWQNSLILLKCLHVYLGKNTRNFNFFYYKKTLRKTGHLLSIFLLIAPRLLARMKLDGIYRLNILDIH